MQKFIANQQQFQGRSFASVVSQKGRDNRHLLASKNTRQATPPVQPIASSINMAQILTRMNDIVNMVNEIKEDLRKIDNRIKYLEEDAFYYHNGNNWKEDTSKVTPTTVKISQLNTQT